MLVQSHWQFIKFQLPLSGEQCHVQIEINRALYMDEATLTKHAGFERLRQNIDDLIGEICRYASHQLVSQAAE